MKKRIKNDRGFTLIELLVAVVVLAIIVVMAIPQISNLIDSNNDAKYDKYASTIETSAKLYTDSYNEDMFGSNQSGCYDIKFDQMTEKKLLKDINLNNITCAGGSQKKTFARVYKSGSHYKYKISILCTNKDNETTILYSNLIEDSIETDCNGRTTDETGPKITVTAPPSGWTTGSGKKATITITDPYGLLENVRIKYVWTTTPNNIADSAWTSKNFGNVRYEEQVSTTLSFPQGKTDQYYLVVKPDSVRDANGNYYSGDTIVSGPFKLDNTAPRITATTNSSNGAWTNDSVTITATASDVLAGVTKIYYSTTSTTASAIKTENKKLTLSGNVGTVTFNTQMEKTVYVMAEDAAGNLSSVVSAGAVKIDTTKPTCTVVPTGTQGTNNWWKSNATITLTTSDTGGSTLSGYNLTTSTTPSYNGTTKTATQTNTTGTTWYGYVKDVAGNVGQCNSGVVKVDTTAPTCSVNATGTSGDNGWFRSNASVSITTSDSGGSTVDSYDLTTSSSSSYKNTSTATQTNTTSTTWYGYVKDKAGNTGTCNKVIKVDTSSPTCTVAASGTTGNNGWYKSNATITLTANDAAGGYNLTTSTSASYGGSTKTATQSNTTGTTWYGYVKDQAGNVGSCNSGTVKVDTVAPATPTLTISGSGTLTVKMSSSDATSGINSFQYRSIGSSSSFSTYSPTGTSSITITTSTPVEIRAVDNAGNASSVAYTRHCNTSGGTLTYDNSKGWICVKNKTQVDSTCTETYTDTCSEWISKSCSDTSCYSCTSTCTRNSWCGTSGGQWCWYCATGWNGPGYYRTDYYDCEDTCCDTYYYDCGYTNYYSCQKTRTYACKKDACPSGFSWYVSGSTCYKTAD